MYAATGAGPLFSGNQSAHKHWCGGGVWRCSKLNRALNSTMRTSDVAKKRFTGRLSGMGSAKQLREF